jgi:hypothetical protein
MKVYVVTSGIYSDYSIERVFLDKNKASEYAEWLGSDHVTVEEYDTSDDDIIKKQYEVRINLKWYPDKEEELIARSWKDCESDSNYNYYSNYIDTLEELVVVRTVNADNYDEQYWKDKLTKHIYDLKAYVEYLKTEGCDAKQIREAIALK